ncbi:hypothetical protein [Clostridium sp. C8]|uniref:Uncharacterized protein n=1 Tax=bioreactor metagenome TaxID=1076179 RepID=A0A645B6V0_9ZZZZ|nr:hypothetical protein [Clostridium sp. C8]
MAVFNKNEFSKKIIVGALLLLVALVSYFGISKVVTAPSFNESTIKSLDDKRDTVMKLTLAAASSSTAISLIPGDAGTPIANKILDLTSYFVIILGAILLEKMLISVVGYLSFTYIIPLACFLGITYLFFNKDILLKLAIKFAILGIVISMVIPVSIKSSDLIYDSYKTSIDETFEATKESEEYIEEKRSEITEEDKGILEKIGDYISDVTSKIGNDVSQMIKKGEEMLGSFIDAIAVLIITSCVIPVVIILLFAWIVKSIFGFDSLKLLKPHAKKFRSISVSKRINRIRDNEKDVNF